MPSPHSAASRCHWRGPDGSTAQCQGDVSARRETVARTCPDERRPDYLTHGRRPCSAVEFTQPRTLEQKGGSEREEAGAARRASPIARIRRDLYEHRDMAGAIPRFAPRREPAITDDVLPAKLHTTPRRDHCRPIPNSPNARKAPSCHGSRAKYGKPAKIDGENAVGPRAEPSGYVTSQPNTGHGARAKTKQCCDHPCWTNYHDDDPAA